MSAITESRPLIVAEVKTRSPYGYQATQSWDELFEIAVAVGDIVAIHTDPNFGGSYRQLEIARSKTEKPILAKGFHQEIEAVHECIRREVNYVLTVGALPVEWLDYREYLWYEPEELRQLQKLPPDVKCVWNARDLRDGSKKAANVQDARNIFPGFLCQASFIRSPADIDPAADAVLIGTHLADFAQQVQNAVQ